VRTRDKTVNSGDPTPRTRRRRRTGAALAVGALVGALAACSDGSTPATSQPPVTATVTDTVTPSPTASPAPTLSDVAKQPTRQGAEEFVRYFFAIYNHAFWTADPSRLQAISDPKCIFCNSAINAVKNIRSANEHVTGGEIGIPTIVAAPGDPKKGYLVNLVIRQAKGQTADPKGAVVGTTPEIKHRRVDAAVRWESDHWVFLDAHIFKEGES
jgi:Family of unknown function (DUF6318)